MSTHENNSMDNEHATMPLKIEQLTADEDQKIEQLTADEAQKDEDKKVAIEIINEINEINENNEIVDETKHENTT